MKINGRYFLDNPESGLYEVSKEYYEQYHEKWNKFVAQFITPNIDSSKSIKGKIFITYTMADENDGNDFKELWENSTTDNNNVNKPKNKKP